MRIVNKTVLAGILGVSKSRVSQYVQAGMPVRADGLVDADAAAAWVADRIDPAKAPMARDQTVARQARAPAPVPNQRGQAGFPAAVLKVLAELPSTVALAVADAGGTRAQAAHAIRVIVEVIHDELTVCAERVGVPGAPDEGWRARAAALVDRAQASVDWSAYFAADGRSCCTGEIYEAR
jgi:hypothetical protein